MRPTVILALTGGPERVFTSPGNCVIGRSLDCDLRIGTGDRRVSRRHCVIEIDPPEARVRDLGSRNGTRVNGVAIDGAAHRLRHGDEIGVGDSVLRVSVGVTGYEIVRRLGEGGQGVVHLARDQATGELVAVKTLWSEFALDRQARDGFLREIENSQALRHPNLVGFRAAGVGGSAFVLASEYCPGGSLAELVAARGGRLAVAEALPLILQVLDGLSYAHQAPIPQVRLADGSTGTARGLVHRDIKPHNILLAGPAEAPVVKIADFGLAKAFDRAGLSGHTRTGTMDGSIAFMPRAQVVDYKHAQPEVDVWAAAATLYWTLTGATPRTFPADEDPVTVVLTEPVTPIRTRDPDIPSRLAEVIDRALVDSPSLAGTSAMEFAEALREATDQPES